ncbi:MAG TPA: DUF3604 domain-containing protein [Pseudomonadales bacterium]|nr:DUF3604 domain-containing protein [Pseudomonadales bacterium]
MGGRGRARAARALLRMGVIVVVLATTTQAVAERRLLWGDTHLHTSYSFDAFLNGNRSAGPDVAYRWARGEPVIHPYHRARVRIGTPLDFLVVSDHAEFLGGIRDIYYEGVQEPDPGPIEQLVYWYSEWAIRAAIDAGEGVAYFADVLPESGDPIAAAATWLETAGANDTPGSAVSERNAWQRLTRIADAYDAPGEFTALIGWEWSSTPGGANLHRVIVSDADGATARRFLPFGSDESPYPEDLWAWLEATRADTGTQFVAIPHNSNLSKGLMFAETSLHGEPVSADYARRRLEWERVVEVTQIKGDSETHPQLSPDDAFADFEEFPWYLQRDPEPYRVAPGDYVRRGLRTGLALEQRLGINPFRLGMIGSTDAHTGLASAEEPNFWGKMAHDSIPENKVGDALQGASGWSMSAAGLAAVWADDNTRKDVVAALRRRETYATTGPRIRVRLFAGYGLDDGALAAPASQLYERAVPMGGTLSADGTGRAPVFVVHAARDPASATLDRVQMVKGWVDATGATHERVFDVVWAGDRVPGADGAVPAIVDSVDRTRATRDDRTGAAQLDALWQDPQFDPALAAFYYVRVLEIPTPRHALYDALALGMETPGEGPAVIQERAYTSPIWFTP